MTSTETDATLASAPGAALPPPDDARARAALDVLSRASSWLARAPALRVRYVEASLGRWLPALAHREAAHAALVGALGGFDAADEASREGRVRALAEVVAALRAEIAPPEAPAPLGRLLPESIVADLPPRAPPPAPLAPPVFPPDGPDTEAAAEPPRDDARDDRPREPRPPREARDRDDRPREARDRDDRPREARDRDDRPRDRADRPRDDRPREARDDRPRESRDDRPREDRPPRDREDRKKKRGDREDRPRDRERRADEVAPAPAPAPEPEPPRPPPAPEPRTFPLGHPEGTGVSITTLDVLDAAEVEALAGVGVASVADLFAHPPIAIDRAGERWIPGVTPEGNVVVRGTVSRRCTRFSPGLRRDELVLTTDRAEVVCRWYGRLPFEVARTPAGGELGLCGRLEILDERPVLFEAEPLGLDGRGGDWLPRYDVPGLPDARVRAVVRAALRTHVDNLQDHLPPEVVERHKLLPLNQAVRDAHLPSNAGRKGRSRLGFDELLQVQLGVALARQRERRERGIATAVQHGLVARAFGQIGWTLSDEQEAAFDDIKRDLRRNQPSQRLLQGDVGAGKHAVVQAAMLVVAENKHQALFLGPDALTAEHRYLFAEQFYRSVDLEPMLLLGAPTRTQAEQLKKGDALIIYATPAILKDVPAFRRLGLVVFEEHGPYGAADVAPFDVQGQRPDLVVFTPAPVPSAIALNVYGPMNLTVLPTPSGRGVDTEAFDATRREEAYQRARDALAAGEQVMIAFPVVRGQDLLSPSEARRLSEVLASEQFPGARIGIFNGGMSREERFRAYDDFQHRRTDVLLATTYVEHGPVVPNATTMIVEYAHQFDLVRLHRLRAHVAHGWRRGRCLLVTSDDPRPDAKHNLELVVNETDGFRIAELDLRHRGLDAVLGERAADAPDFAWADPVSERDLMVRTRQEAMRLLNQDPGLKRRSNRGLLHLVRARFGEELGAEAGDAPATQASSAGAGAANNARRRRRRRGR